LILMGDGITMTIPQFRALCSIALDGLADGTDWPRHLSLALTLGMVPALGPEYAFPAHAQTTPEALLDAWSYAQRVACCVSGVQWQAALIAWSTLLRGQARRCQIDPSAADAAVGLVQDAASSAVRQPRDWFSQIDAALSDVQAASAAFPPLSAVALI